mgnify:CR=1 FL=1
MSKQVNFSLNLREQVVDCSVSIDPPDPEVGVTGWQIYDYQLLDQTGKRLDWELDEDEMDRLYEAMPNPEEDDSDYEDDE